MIDEGVARREEIFSLLSVPIRDGYATHKAMNRAAPHAGKMPLHQHAWLGH